MSLAHQPVPPSSPPEKPRFSVEISGVTKRFGATGVLHGIDLSIEHGEFIAIIGRSGCGKSTLLRLIAGLDQPDHGRIQRGSAQENADAAPPRLLFQDARLLPWQRVRENVAIGQRRPGWQGMADAALARVGLADKGGHWPATLSGGQRQRVALARALVSKPQLLLLDEPLGALDALTRLDMQSLLEQVWREQGFTAILVTHDVSEAVALADRVVVLEQGRIAEIWSVPNPRPRLRADAGLRRIESQILARVLRQSGANIEQISPFSAEGDAG